MNKGLVARFCGPFAAIYSWYQCIWDAVYILSIREIFRSLQALARLEQEDDLIRKQTLQLGKLIIDFNAERGNF